MRVLTANRLKDGEAVWFSPDHRWAETIDVAEVARDVAAEQKLAELGKSSYLRNEVVDVALIDVALVDGRVVPTRLRERVRAAGPTNRPDLGKQSRPASARAA